MSNSLITSFTVGVSIHVFTSQLKNGLGLKLERKSGLFKLPKTWYEVCVHLPEANVATLITWFICIIIIYLVKAQINDRFKKKMKIPIPIELIMVIFGTVASYFLELNSNYQVKIVEYIPKGIPSPKLPDVTLATDYLADGILIAVVSYAQTVALAKTFGLLHKYEIDPDQEMFACGGANVVCSLFSGYITAASVSRTVVVNGAGGKTQVTSLIACSIVLLVIVVLAPYFYYLPLCVLAAIIVVNLRGMFWKLTQLNPLRKQSKSDFIVWVVTFSVSVFVDVIPGLLAGIAVSFLLIIIITQQSPVTLKGVVDGTQETRTPSLYHSVDLSSDIKILHINKPLCFANSDIFVQKVFKNIDINIIKVQKQKAKLIKSEKNANNSNHNDNELKDLEPLEAENKIDDTQDVMLSLETDMSLPKYVILDISGVSFIDLMGASALQLIITELNEIDIKVLITNIAVVVYDTLDRVDFIKKNEDRLYLTLFDALQDIRTSSESAPNNLHSQDTTEA
ncbi:sulfate transporter isoform X2 [Patella vulgata]|nr:sulfate transporter isoform X2 [Patella vulgata]